MLTCKQVKNTFKTIHGTQNLRKIYQIRLKFSSILTFSKLEQNRCFLSHFWPVLGIVCVSNGPNLAFKHSKYLFWQFLIVSDQFLRKFIGTPLLIRLEGTPARPLGKRPRIFSLKVSTLEREQKTSGENLNAGVEGRC